MKSELNFVIKKDGMTEDMHELGVWVESFHIYSPNITRTKIKVPGMAGAHSGESTEDERLVSIAMQIETDNMVEFDRKKHRLFNLLYSEEPFTIVRDLTPDREIHVIQEGEYDIQDITDSDGRFDVTLTMLDPYVYGQELTTQFTESAVIENPGTAEAFPIIEATVKESVTSFMITKGDDDFFMIGRPFDIDKQLVEQFPEIKRWRMESLVGWSHMTEGFFLDDEVTGGTVSGSSLEVENGTSFVPQSYGSTQSGWYGPAVRTSFPKSIGDFSITLGVQANNNGNGIGKVMAIFLDENDEIVTSIGLINTRLGSRNIRVLARMNDGKNIKRQRVMDYPGDSGPESTVFSNRSLNIRLRREGNKFDAYTWQVRDGVQHARHGETIIDDTQEFQRPIRQVVLYFAKHGSNPVFPMHISGLRVHENNTLILDENMIPYIAHEGDKITVDSKNELVMIDDEPATNLKVFGANYFGLDPGENHLFTFPEGSFDTNIKHRPAWR